MFERILSTMVDTSSSESCSELLQLIRRLRESVEGEEDEEEDLVRCAQSTLKHTNSGAI